MGGVGTEMMRFVVFFLAGLGLQDKVKANKFRRMSGGSKQNGL